MKSLLKIIFFFLIASLSLSSCKKSPEEEAPAWGESYTGSYVFTTVYQNAVSNFCDTTLYNGSISVQDEALREIKVDYQPYRTFYLHVSDDGTLQAENGGFHSGFSGKIEKTGTIEFQFYSYWESWHVSGTKCIQNQTGCR